MPYIFLALAIISEVVATTALKASAEFTKPVPSVIVVVGYAISFYLLALVLRSLPVGTTYAIWAGMGIFLIAVIGAVYYREVPDLPAVVGMTLIIAGVVVLQGFSKTPAA
ncbi:MAG: multidrug efflux SMR transporter [Gammaproteobacteria bacterium]|nr:multidrug efflux SMR transporter [Gammaproteobacteria bacterium]